MTLPAATIPAADTSAFEIPGTVRVQTSAGVQDVRCTDSTATSFTGCTGGTGTRGERRGGRPPTRSSRPTPRPPPAWSPRTASSACCRASDGRSVTVLYVEKQLDYFTTADQANACAVPFATLNQIGEGKNKAPYYGNNEDRSTVRSATTRDGIHFTDNGPVNGLGDNESTSATATRFVSPSGTVVRNPDGTLGLFYAAGNCYDGDSDGFHYIGYATSKDGVNWTHRQRLHQPAAVGEHRVPADHPGPVLQRPHLRPAGRARPRRQDRDHGLRRLPHPQAAAQARHGAGHGPERAVHGRRRATWPPTAAS